MTAPLSWTLSGNDQLTQTLDKLATSVDKLTRQFGSGTNAAQGYGRGLAGAGTQAAQLGNQVGAAGRATSTTSGHLTTAQRTAGMAGTAFGRLGSMASAAASAVRTVGVATVVGLGAAVAAAATMGIRTAAANETASISFEVLLGSAEKAKTFMGKLADFANNTPFDLPGLRTAASGFLAVGINADRIIPLLTRIGDSTAAMNTGAEGIDRATYALKQMALSGRATKEDLNQLADAGVPIFDALAAHMGLSVADMLDALSDGKISAEAVFQAIETGAGSSMQRTSGIMARQALTMEGIWSGFKDKATLALANFMEPVMPGLKGVIDWLSTNIPVGLDWLTQLGSRFKTIFEGDPVPGEVMSSLRTMALDLVPKLKDNLDKLLKTVEENKDGLDKFGKFLSIAVIPALGMTAGWTINLVTGLAQIGTILMATVVPALRFFTALFLTNMAFIIDAAAHTFGWIPGLGPQLREAQGKFHEFADGVMAKLNEMNGTTVNINYVENWRQTGMPTSQDSVRRAGGFGTGQQEFAAGGMVLGPEGSPQAAIVHAGEQVLTRQQQADNARGASASGESEMLAPVSINLDGFNVWQGLLKFKKRSARTSLGLG